MYTSKAIQLAANRCANNMQIEDLLDKWDEWEVTERIKALCKIFVVLSFVLAPLFIPTQQLIFLYPLFVVSVLAGGFVFLAMLYIVLVGAASYCYQQMLTVLRGSQD